MTTSLAVASVPMPATRAPQGRFVPEHIPVRQTTLSVTLEVKPESEARLSAIIAGVRQREESPPFGVPDQYQRFMRDIPVLHFMSLTVFPSADYDPLLVLEANFDGAPGVFWGQIEALIGDDLRAMLRCCKRPSDETGPLFDAVTAAAARTMVAPYFEARTLRPSVFHHGNRGLSRNRILAEEELFNAIRIEFMTAQDGTASPYRDIPAVAVHDRLRTALLPAFPWLAIRAPARITIGDRIDDWARLIAFVLAALVALALPGAILGLIVARAHWWIFALASLIPVMPTLLVLWLRHLEKRDSSHDAPPVDEVAAREMARREDRIPQNHMGSIVLIRPGILRSILSHVGHLGLGLVLRATATDGYLSSMRTVHFAHWAFVNNGSRLMFHSNFDQSWESYLDDFIEKAHVGLTLAWGSGVGFPPTRFLVEDGASYGRRFKAWARHSMAASQLWYSAYKNLTVNQIERSALIADGLRKPKLTAKEADAWIVLL